MAAEITTLQSLLARLQDRAVTLRSVDPSLARDVDLLYIVLGEQARAHDRARADIRVLASAILAIDQLASRTTGMLVTDATRRVLERMILETDQLGRENTERRHTS